MVCLSFKCVKLVVVTLNTCYFTGMFWYILCDLYWHYYIRFTEEKSYINVNAFIWNRPNHWDHALANTYFAMTTMSTVGFGDLHPENDFERIVCLFIFLFGNGIFAMIIQDMLQMFELIKCFNKENERTEDLNKFFNLLCRYNKRNAIKGEIRERIEAHFFYRWNHDKNLAFT